MYTLLLKVFFIPHRKDEDVDQYDMAGMDDTWLDSQPDVVTVSDKEDIENVIEEIDSDADSDIIPQYDGPPDEKGRNDTILILNSPFEICCM